MKRKSSYVYLLLAFLSGLSLLLYPTISAKWNRHHQSQAIGQYSETVSKLSEEDYSRLWAEAYQYNEDTVNRINNYTQTEYQEEVYHEVLNVGTLGVMGYVDIPCIDCNLPIYHGTSDAVLQKGAGHLNWSSLPVGGAGTHCVISGHRGLPSATLFTDLGKLVVGDIFYLHVLDDVLAYEIDQILTVEPTETNSLLPVAGQDYCTLVTCTPYGINTHRMLVRGHRIEIQNEKVIRVTADAIQIEPIIVAPFLAVPLLAFLILWLAARDRKRKETSRWTE